MRVAVDPVRNVVLLLLRFQFIKRKAFLIPERMLAVRSEHHAPAAAENLHRIEIQRVFVHELAEIVAHPGQTVEFAVRPRSDRHKMKIVRHGHGAVIVRIHVPLLAAFGHGMSDFRLFQSFEPFLIGDHSSPSSRTPAIRTRPGK